VEGRDPNGFTPLTFSHLRSLSSLTLTVFPVNVPNQKYILTFDSALSLLKQLPSDTKTSLSELTLELTADSESQPLLDFFQVLSDGVWDEWIVENLPNLGRLVLRIGLDGGSEEELDEVKSWFERCVGLGLVKIDAD